MSTNREKIAYFLREAYVNLAAAHVLMLQDASIEVLSDEALARNMMPGIIGGLEEVWNVWPSDPVMH